jgi:hypothetical protein
MLAVGGVVATVATAPIAEAEPKVCLKFRDLGSLKRVDDRTFIANTRYGKGKYLVKMRSTCRGLDWPDNFYSVRLYSDRECFDGDDVLEFRYGGACFVESVTLAPAQ